MASKKSGGKERLVGPLYESGAMNGPVGGPTGGLKAKDPLRYLPGADDGLSAPGGSMTERTAQSTGRGSKDQSRNPGAK